MRRSHSSLQIRLYLIGAFILVAGLAGFLAAWLAVHWYFELHVDRQAAQALGSGAEDGLREVLAASTSPVGWLSTQPPLRWRLRMLGGN